MGTLVSHDGFEFEPEAEFDSEEYDLHRRAFEVAQSANEGVVKPKNAFSERPQSSTRTRYSDSKSEFVAERSVVSAILADNSNYILVSSILTAEDFSDSISNCVYQAIFEIMEGEVAGVTVADSVTVLSRPGVAKFIELCALDEWVENVRGSSLTDDLVTSWAKTVSSVSMSRNLSNSLDRAKSLMKGDRSIEDKAEEIGRLVSGAVETKSSGLKGVGVFAASAVSKMIEQAYREPGDMIGIATGFEELDAKTSGLRGGQFVIIAARPAMGKTSFALAIAMHAVKSGKGTLMCSLEMSGDELATRVISTVTKIDASRLKNSALNDDEWDSVAGAVEYLDTLPLHLDDQAKLGIPELRASARKLKREGKLDLVIVDYIQLMEGNPKIQRSSQISEISRGLKLLAKELDVPVIALSQLNRDLEKRPDKRPIMSDLRESGALEQDADLILFLYRDEVYDKHSNDKGIAEIIIGKQRSGPCGTVRAIFDARTAAYLDEKSPAVKNVTVNSTPHDQTMSPFMASMVNKSNKAF